MKYKLTESSFVNGTTSKTLTNRSVSKEVEEEEELTEEDQIPNTTPYDHLNESEKVVIKILESEILDPVWFQILRNHPEYHIDEEGKARPLERNHNLRHHLLPRQHKDLPSSLSSSLICHNVISTVSLPDHRLTAISAESGVILTYLPLRPLPPEPPGGDGSEGGGGGKQNTTVTTTSNSTNTMTDYTVNPPIFYTITPSSHIIIKTSQIISLDDINPGITTTTAAGGGGGSIENNPSHALRHTMRLVLLGLDLFTETMTPEALAAAAKKAGNTKKGATTPADYWKPRRILKYHLQVVDLFLSLQGPEEAIYEKIHDMYLDCPFAYDSEEYLFALHDYIRLNLNEDGSLLAMVINDENQQQPLCRLYQLSLSQGYKARRIIEEKEEDLLIDKSPRQSSMGEPSSSSSSSSSSSGVVMKTPVIVAQWQIDNQRIGSNNSSGSASGSGSNNSTAAPNAAGGVTAGGGMIPVGGGTNTTGSNSNNNSSTTAGGSGSGSGSEGGNNRRRAGVRDLRFLSPIIIIPSSSSEKQEQENSNNNNNKMATPTTTAAAATSVSSNLSDNNSFVPFQLSKYPTIRLVMTLTGYPFLIKLGLQVKPEDKPTGKEAKKPDTKASAGKGMELLPPTPPPIPCEIYEVIRWNLSHNITEIDLIMNDKREIEYIVIGQEDGQLSLWNILLNQLIVTLGKHPVAITRLKSYFNTNTKFLQIVAGAADGTLTYYNNNNNSINNKVSTTMITTTINSSSDDNNNDNDNGGIEFDLYNTTFINYRQDLFNDCIIAIHILPSIGLEYNHITTAHGNSGKNGNNGNNGKTVDNVEKMDIVLVQYASDHIVVYTLPDCYLIGSLGSIERINFQDYTSIRIGYSNIPLRYFIPIPIDLPPPVEEVVSVSSSPPSKPVGKGPTTIIQEPEQKEEVEPSESILPPPPLIMLSNTVKENEIKELLKNGCSLERYQTFMNISLTSKGILNCIIHAYRNEKFVLSWTSLNSYITSAMKTLAKPPTPSSCLPVTTSSSSSLPKIDSRLSSRKNSHSSLLKGSKLKDIHQLSQKTLKLTEERLEAYQRQLENKNDRSTTTTTSRNNSSFSIQSSQTSLMKKALSTTMDPVQVVKEDLIESKRLRDTRKEKLTKTLGAFVSLT